jgi:hypothetical protein
VSRATNNQARDIHRAQIEPFGRNLQRRNIIGRLYGSQQLGGRTPKLDDLPADGFAFARGAVGFLRTTNASHFAQDGEVSSGVESDRAVTGRSRAALRSGHRAAACRPMPICYRNCYPTPHNGAKLDVIGKRAGAVVLPDFPD